MHNFFRTWKVKEVEKVHKELAKDYMDLFVRYRQAEDKIKELEEDKYKKQPAPLTCINIGEALKEAKENDKMIIKKKTEKTMKEFLHMLVDKSALEVFTFNTYNSDWFNKHNTVNIELLTKMDFPEFEMHGGAGMDKKIVLIEEIEIDEDTEFERLIEVNKSGAINSFYDTSIKKQLFDGSSEYHISVDDKLVKIWDKEKGMLE